MAHALPNGRATSESELIMVGVRAQVPDWVQSWFDAWNKRDGDGIVAHLAADVVYQDMALGERFDGAEAVRQFAQAMESTFSTDYRFDVGQQFVSSGDSFSYEWTLSGTNDCANPELGLPATGRSFAIPGVSIGLLHRDKIVENRDYWDLAGYLRQVGLMQQSP